MTPGVDVVTVALTFVAVDGAVVDQCDRDAARLSRLEVGVSIGADQRLSDGPQVEEGDGPGDDGEIDVRHVEVDVPDRLDLDAGRARRRVRDRHRLGSVVRRARRQNRRKGQAVRRSIGRS